MYEYIFVYFFHFSTRIKFKRGKEALFYLPMDSQCLEDNKNLIKFVDKQLQQRACTEQNYDYYLLIKLH